jgi:hypothetical protein
MLILTDVGFVRLSHNGCTKISLRLVAFPRSARRSAGHRGPCGPPAAFVLNQNAYQRGILIAPVLAIITAADPLVSIALASLWLNEHFNASPAGIAGEVASLALMTAGIVIIARRSPQAVRQLNTPAVPKTARNTRVAADAGGQPHVRLRPSQPRCHVGTTPRLAGNAWHVATGSDGERADTAGRLSPWTSEVPLPIVPAER